MSVADLMLPPGSNFTFLSPCHDSTSWLDHIISSRPDILSNITVLHDLCIFDHFPLSFDVTVEINASDTPISGIDPGEFVNWKLYESFKTKISDIMDDRFGDKIHINDVFLCDKAVCNDSIHKFAIDQLFDYLIESYLVSTEVLKFKKRNCFKPVPGWNSLCKQKYHEARHHFLTWKECEMDKNCIEYTLMKNSRAEFKAALEFLQAK